MKTNQLTLLVLFLLFINNNSYAQKADIDNHYISISYAQVPTNYIDESNRTYSVNSYGSYKYTGRHNDEQINVYGWKRVDKSAHLQIKPNVSSFAPGIATQSTRVDEVKDKDGKVTSSTRYYWYSVTNTGLGTLYIYGAKNEIPPKQKKSDKPKEMSKKEKEQANNPFLKNVDTKDAATNKADVNYNANSNLPLAYSTSLGASYEYKGPEYTSASQAGKEFYARLEAETAMHEERFLKEMNGRINGYVNRLYGYNPVTNRNVKFKRLDSDKHPEFKMYNSATEAFKTIFAKMRYNKDTKEIEQDLAPIIEYFQGVVEKYHNKDDKGQRKLRAATLYNLARIYQYLDQHDKTITIGKQMILEKEDDDAGEDFIEESEEIARQLAFHKMTSRHIVPADADQAKDDVGQVLTNEQP
jgi:hypothetical protein